MSPPEILAIKIFVVGLADGWRNHPEMRGRSSDYVVGKFTGLAARNAVEKIKKSFTRPRKKTRVKL